MESSHCSIAVMRNRAWILETMVCHAIVCDLMSQSFVTIDHMNDLNMLYILSPLDSWPLSSISLSLRP